jgi:hypothetical protein
VKTTSTIKRTTKKDGEEAKRSKGRDWKQEGVTKPKHRKFRPGKHHTHTHTHTHTHPRTTHYIIKIHLRLRMHITVTQSSFAASTFTRTTTTPQYSRNTGVQVLRDIRKLQSSSDLIIPKTRFIALVRQIAANHTVHVSADAKEHPIR